MARKLGLCVYYLPIILILFRKWNLIEIISSFYISCVRFIRGFQVLLIFLLYQIRRFRYEILIPITINFDIVFIILIFFLLFLFVWSHLFKTQCFLLNRGLVLILNLGSSDHLIIFKAPPARFNSWTLYRNHFPVLLRKVLLTFRLLTLMIVSIIF